MDLPAHKPTTERPPTGPDQRIRVLVVDDSVVMRNAIQRLVNADAGCTVVDVCRNGQEAVDKARVLKPDVVTMDVEMPVLDGIAALQQIRRQCVPAPAVLMCSSLTSAGSHMALKAMRMGAADVIAKDSSTGVVSLDAFRDELLAKIKAVAPRRTPAVHAPAPPTGKAPPLGPGEIDLIVVGSSTGGPPVLETLMLALPADMTCAVVIAQHMPLTFTKSLAERLDEQSAVTVVHAEDGMRILPGTAYIAPGGKHLRVVRRVGRLHAEIGDEPRSALYRPSANELFASGARACGSRVLGVMCTGMGDDGVVGARELKERGGKLIAQDESSCVVYGMPKAVVSAGLADFVGPPAELARVMAGIRSLRPGTNAA